MTESNEIIVQGARLHNLKNVSLSIPKNQLVVLTGLSGSGKSTLAFETLNKEGMRQYLEALGFVTMGINKPEVDRIIGLSPSISVDQHQTNRSPRSTVGTSTEVFTYLRILFARIGHRACLHCGADIPPEYDVSAESDDSTDADITYPCPNCGTPVPSLGMAHFSFNKPQGACPTCTGIGSIHTANIDLLVDPTKSLLDGGVIRWDIHEIKRYSQTLEAAGKYYGFRFDVNTPLGELGDIQRDILLHGVNSDQFKRHFPHAEPPDTVTKGRFEGIVPNLIRRYAESNNPSHRAKLGELLMERDCPDCEGHRLRPESRAVTINRKSIINVASIPLTELLAWIQTLNEHVSHEALLVAQSIIDDLNERIRRLVDVGVGYLSLDRATPSVSGGEAHRLKLAALLGSSLTGVLYVLDEPTIGLHPRDHAMLIRVMRQLRDLGNTVLVVEHDLQIMAAADTLIDMGPGAGQHGGEVVAIGTPDEVAQCQASITGHYLSGMKSIPIPASRRRGNGRSLTIKGAQAHNLKNVTVDIPLGTFTSVIGVSGSGKSSLILDILGAAANRHYHQSKGIPAKHQSIMGWEHLDDIITIDQTAIGRTPRSNAATYTDVFTAIRQTFADQAKHLDPRHFSFNVPGGRCDRCDGAGVLTVNMHFLPDVEVRCPACQGQRFKEEILAVAYRGYNIAQVLDLTIEEALTLFEDIPTIARKLQLMVDVGLGYLKLGQPVTMLSGGEAQRIRLAKELGRSARGHTLYLLDEPTTGLHPDDINRLLAVLQRLVDANNTVLVIEHSLEMMLAADWLIELGPEGGTSGGYLIATGTPEDVLTNSDSQTAPYLMEIMQ